MNKVLLYGRMARDAELKTAGNSDKTYTRFTIACNRKTKDGGTDFVPCIAWGKTAETVEKYFHKGNRISAVGRIQTGSYDGKDGKVYTTDIVIEEVEFVESKAESESTASESGAQTEDKPKSSGKKETKTDMVDDFMNIPDGFESELPFA